MNIKAQFGKNTREIRTHRGISQEKLADLSGLHRTYINSIENGKRNVSIENIEKIAKSLNVKITDFFKET